jgi:hypothetical protein
VGLKVSVGMIDVQEKNAEPLGQNWQNGANVDRIKKYRFAVQRKKARYNAGFVEVLNVPIHR